MGTNLERGFFVKQTRIMVNEPRQLCAIQEQHKQEKLLECKLSKLLHVT